MSEQSFCEKCGVRINADAHFCPSCGYRIPGRNEEEVAKERQFVRDMVLNRAKWAGYLMLIYGIPLIIVGVYYFVASDSIANAIWNDPTAHQQLVDWGLTFDDVTNYLSYWGIGWLVSGIAGICSAVLCIKRVHYIPAVILCIVSVIFSITGFLSLIIGLIAFWLVISSRLGFKEYEDKLDEIVEQNIV